MHVENCRGDRSCLLFTLQLQGWPWRSLYTYTVAAVLFYLVHTDNFEETGKTNLCFCQGPEKGSTVGCDNSNCNWFYLSS